MHGRSVAAFLLMAATALTGGACGSRPKERVFGVYAHDSRALVRLDYDYDGNGRIDVRTYMRGSKPMRLEADANGDGFVERWEYYDVNGALLRIGGSTQGDGREDTWMRIDGRQRIVETASLRDRQVDRREVFDGDALLRAETDANRDGRPDRWEEFRGGVLVHLLLDDDLRHGRPTRRISYGGADAARIETDVDGDGTWEATDGR